MERYIVFLRGVNIGGKNKIVMSNLKKELEKMKFSDVVAYFNSGNALFPSDNDNDAEVKEQIELMIENEFGLKIPVHIIRCDYLQKILRNAPHRNAYQKCNWWKKTASAGIAEKLTIRTANTIRKLLFAN